MKPAIEISIESDDWDALDAPERLAETAIGETLRQSGAKLREGAEISILLCDDAFIAELNAKWRGIAKPTNVLSFPSNDARSPVLGDIVIAYETAEREAREEDKAFRDHVAHLLVHGCLHLLGYDHLVEAEAEAMEALERSILAALDIADPYAGALVQIAGR